MPKTYLIYIPTIKGSVEEELIQCLDQIEDPLSKGLIPVKLNIFVDLPDFKTFLKARKSISQSVIDTFTSFCPALNITVHPPEKPWKVVVEALFVPSGSVKVTGKFFNSIPYIILESEAGKELWAGGASSYRHTDDTRAAAEKAFDIMSAILRNEHMTMDNIVRQWNYIGNILDMKDGLQNYQIFNEVRYEYYSKFRKVHNFPAATGVGMKHGGVILDFYALAPAESVKILPVENPNQVNAYSYGQQVLKGSVEQGKSAKHPPQFERALLIANNHDTVLYISGTASIIGQEIVGKDDIGKQTLVTIENIKRLADAQRLSRLISNPVMFRGNYSLFRVYIRNQNDFNTVRRICSEHFPQIPAVYIEADICRDDLLMEIEAEVELA
jgi:enamine deaminase RidA (YjgF/YER057c/UK114 family)